MYVQPCLSLYILERVVHYCCSRIAAMGSRTVGEEYNCLKAWINTPFVLQWLEDNIINEVWLWVNNHLKIAINKLEQNNNKNRVQWFTGQIPLSKATKLGYSFT
jgi:hypothetical protein